MVMMARCLQEAQGYGCSVCIRRCVKVSTAKYEATKILMAVEVLSLEKSWQPSAG